MRNAPQLENFDALKLYLPKTDSIVENYVIFDLGGNKYRLLARVNYSDQITTIIEVMTHGEYSKEHWKRKGSIASALALSRKRKKSDLQ